MGVVFMPEQRKSRKRRPSGRQVEQLLKLFTVWPKASGKTCQRYLLQTYGTKLTRAALQQARERAGLSTPQYKEDTLKKRAFIRLATASHVKQAGVRPPEVIRRVIRKQLKTRFDEDVNTVLLTSWIEATLNEIKDRGVEDIIGEATADLYSYGFFKQEGGKQVELL
jgi:hypothetical protein